jgi:hypothetical protein
MMKSAIGDIFRRDEKKCEKGKQQSDNFMNFSERNIRKAIRPLLRRLPWSYCGSCGNPQPRSLDTRSTGPTWMANSNCCESKSGEVDS